MARLDTEQDKKQTRKSNKSKGTPKLLHNKQLHPLRILAAILDSTAREVARFASNDFSSALVHCRFSLKYSRYTAYVHARDEPGFCMQSAHRNVSGGRYRVNDGKTSIWRRRRRKKTATRLRKIARILTIKQCVNSTLR